MARLRSTAPETGNARDEAAGRVDVARGGRGGGGRGLAERLQSLSPEERERMLEQMRARGVRSGGDRERRGSPRRGP